MVENKRLWPNCEWIAGSICSWMVFLIPLFINGSALTPLDEQQTRHLDCIRMHCCGKDTGVMVALTFSSPGKLFSTSQAIRRRIHQIKHLCGSVYSHSWGSSVCPRLFLNVFWFSDMWSCHKLSNSVSTWWSERWRTEPRFYLESHQTQFITWPFWSAEHWGENMPSNRSRSVSVS